MLDGRALAVVDTGGLADGGGLGMRVEAWGGARVRDGPGSFRGEEAWGFIVRDVGLVVRALRGTASGKLW